jgi:isopenicillin-N N-acyltransferase like protein
MQIMRRTYLHIAFLVMAALGWPGDLYLSHACTLWGATGQAVAGGGTLIAKNRDWAPDQHHELHIVRPQNGYSSLVLVAVGGGEPGIKAGVNEKGLVIVSASASQIAIAERKKYKQKPNLMSRFLSECASVDEVLNRIGLLRRPVFYMLGDARELAVVEVSPDGSRSTKRTASGTLQHTNHYCAIESPAIQSKPSRSSLQRLARIEEFLKWDTRPHQLEDFIRFSEDKGAGPDNSIWRTGSSPAKARTLATWLVAVRPSGSPQLHLKTADPGQPERTSRLAVTDALQMQSSGTIALDGDLCRSDQIK